ncbi:MAG TPA: glycine cleavage T C-terminal barrel domain-containing protein [Kofleriaceae bacterium]|nr:glycine cleavage T C-terminal barrel domain-containing protein [Kofleriaceae bacterium]
MTELCVDQAEWAKIIVTGADRARFIHGMCSANILTLAPGGWIRATMLTVKGRVASVFDVIHRGDDLLLVCEPILGDKTVELLDKHAIMDDVAFARADELPLHRVWTDPASVWTAPPVLEPPPIAADPAAVEVRRVEAGMPRYGTDVSETNFPFESLLARHVDYDKGCYIGQEPVSRVYFKGAASKTMRGLAVAGEAPVEVGAAVDHPSRAGAGTVSSAVFSPDFGSIALAYVHRSAWEPGAEVTVGGRPARLVELPFRS